MENLKLLRKKRKINQLKLAMDIGVTQESISKYESDSAFPSKETLIKLADYFNCSIDYLMDRTDNPTVLSKDKKYVINRQTENLIFRYNRLSPVNKRKLEGCLLSLEFEQNSHRKKNIL